MRRGLDAFLAALARAVAAIFFRSIEVIGRERLPSKGPLVVVANHVNGLIDPLFILGTLGLEVRFLGKSTLWRIPLLAQLLDLAGVIPVYRRQDEGVDPSRNRETFARCRTELAHGGRIALFPEGISHDEPELQPLKSGAARLALEAEALVGPLGVRILPVGLVFEEKTQFRSRALVVVGEPIDPAVELSIFARDEAAAARALTARLDAALRAVTLNFDSWQEARRIDRAAELFDRTALALPLGRPLAEEFHLQQALLAGSEIAARREPERMARVAKAVADYDRLLAAAKLSDRQVIADYPLLPVARFVALALARLLFRLPAAIVGAIANLVPYQLARLAARFVRHDPDQVSTYKLYPSLLFYPLTWLAEAAAAWRWLGGLPSALAALGVAPAAGWIALRFFEEERQLFRESRAFLLLRTRRRLHAELRRRRGELQREIEELARASSRS